MKITTMKKVTSIEMSENEFRNYSDEYCGFCLTCGDEAYQVEPDARKYKCESCGEYTVYGIDELLIMDKIEIIQGEENDE